ncbi:MAG: diaminopimelate epimerase [Rhodospirillaceae bacterium]|nr:diaminopimelate epimerase [Rhodospirillaceae bacterium]
MTSGRAFLKMHGLGNDFVVVDARGEPFAPDERVARHIADRHTGIGCDQLIVIERPRNRQADAFMRIRNADGGEVAACGNAARCVAQFLMAESGRDQASIETAAGRLDAARADRGRIAVDMGPARTDWRDIPLARAMDTERLPIALGPLKDPVAVSMGNPHMVFFVADADAVDLATLGPVLEHNALFPERANVGVATVLAPDRLRLRVWERGAGLTRACGSGACAAVVAAHRRGLSERRAAVAVDGGELSIEWLPNGHVTMTGPAAIAFTGIMDGALLS